MSKNDSQSISKSWSSQSYLAGKFQKGRKVHLTTITEVFEAAAGPEEQAGSKGTKVGWLLAQLTEEMVEAAGERQGEDD